MVWVGMGATVPVMDLIETMSGEINEILPTGLMTATMIVVGGMTSATMTTMMIVIMTRTIPEIATMLIKAKDDAPGKGVALLTKSWIWTGGNKLRITSSASAVKQSLTGRGGTILNSQLVWFALPLVYWFLVLHTKKPITNNHKSANFSWGILCHESLFIILNTSSITTSSHGSRQRQICCGKTKT